MANKNVKLNIKIIKALSVGISATMIAQPMSAFAYDPLSPSADSGNNTTQSQTSETSATAEAQAAASAASQATSDYESSVGSAAEVANSIDADATTSDFAEALENVNNDLAPSAEDTTDHHNNGSGQTDNGAGQTDNGAGQTDSGTENQTEPEPQPDNGSETDSGNQTEPDPGSGDEEDIEPEPDAAADSGDSALSSAIGSAGGALNNIAEKETEMQATISAADKINREAGQLSGAGAELAEKAEVVAGAAASAIDSAADSVSADRQSLSSATSEADAHAAFNNINTAVSAADAAVESAEAQLADIQAEFNSKKAEYDEKAAAFAALTEQLEAAKAEYESLKDTAGDAAVEAAEKLGILTGDVAELKAAAEAAQADYQTAGFGLISELETEIADMISRGKTPEWRSNDPDKVTYAKLFDTIVEFYYVPEVEGAEFVSAKWSRFSGTFADGSTYGDVLNYCTVTYKDAEGNLYTKLLNYKVADANNQKGGKNGEYSGIVIFEKTEHIVYDGTDLTEAEISALDKGEIVEKNGDIIVKNNTGKYVGYNTEDGKTTVKVTETDTENLVIADGTQVVDIVDGTEVAGDYSYDKKAGKVSQTTTADVAVTTYTGARLDAAAETFEDTEGAKAQFVSDMQDKINALKEGESIVIGAGESAVTYQKGDTATEAGFEASEKVTSYTVSGSFIETYTKDYSKKYNDEFEFSNGVGLGIFGIGENHSTARVGDVVENENGGVTVEYGKLTKAESTSFGWLKDLLSGHSDQKDLEASLSEKFAAEGKIFVGIDGWNWSIGTADVYIIDANEAEAATAATEEAAYQAFEDAIRAGITDGGQIHSTKTEITENKSYGYKLLDYFIKTVAVENKIISETTWNQVAQTAQTQYKNDNWYSGDIILSEYDRTTGNDFVTDKGHAFELDNSGENKTGAFRQKIDNAADTAAKYADLITKLGDSEKKVSAAEEAVKLLKDSIAKLEFNGSTEELASFKASLQTAQETLDAAKSGRDSLLSQISEIRTELNNKISELNPVVPGGSSDEAPTVVVEDAAPALAATPAATPAASITEAGEETEAAEEAVETTVEETAGVGETEEIGGSEAGASVETASIADEDAAKAAGPAVETAEKIDDEGPALASMPETQKMSWWWALIVLVLGTAGMNMYRRHIEKKNAAKQTTTTGEK